MLKDENSILESWQNEKSFFDEKLKELFQMSHFQDPIFDFQMDESLKNGSAKLRSAIQYALFTGGKRFRPLLTFASSKVLNKDFKDVLPWAMAIECIHTYSLIHDDLPCMDNDDERRGLPTVHKKYDEATALLAGDALLTEAFGIVAKAYGGNKNLGKLITLLVERAGFQGMVSGQANDLSFLVQESSLNNFKEQQLFIHLQKTAALISAACLGPFLIFNESQEKIDAFNKLSLLLGILFQLKDDFLDAKDKTENNMVQTLGEGEAHNTYNVFKEMAENLMESLSVELSMKPYYDLMEYNSKRIK